ncbi:efflux transporter outer membrane subunit [Acidocella aromatica]|uniref:NodT family efflux transporter outer membrane factor (OMF) lipoprotein n=1 Tax=Acidocella aromatica TaxID=1303579 RepID=A0A840V8T2_9PROT|nr:efflux transporter outer membrane subunit [Acidocella aromatica]MBB5372156.1 NodT family efflux transporter outer membrane factor (OMF) lipoprotein [Acidocella aromatica]
MVSRRIVPGLALLLAGCTVGPDYKVPDNALVKSPEAQLAFSTTGQAANIGQPPADWWQLYDNPTLNALVPRALANNTNIREAQANLERAYAFIKVERDASTLSAGADGAAVYAHDSAQAVLQDTEAPRQEEYNAGIAVSYDLDLFGGIRRGVEAASDTSEAAEAARDLVRVNVAAETTRAYAEICDDGNEIAALQQVIALAQRQVGYVNLLRQNGRAVDFDVSAQQEQVSTLQSELPPLQARQLNAAYRLSTLLGQPPAAYDPAWLTCHEPLRLAQPIPVGDGRSLLRRRPDVREAERELAAATARIGVETANLYPDIRLGVSVGSTGAAASAFSAVTNRFAAGPMVSWDLNQGATRARIEAAKAATRARLAAFDGTVLNALLETQTSLKAYGAQLDRMDELTATRDSAAKVAADTTAMYQGGRVNALTALAAQQKLASADMTVADAEADVTESQIAVFLALGGGWQTQ